MAEIEEAIIEKLRATRERIPDVQFSDPSFPADESSLPEDAVRHVDAWRRAPLAGSGVVHATFGDSEYVQGPVAMVPFLNALAGVASTCGRGVRVERLFETPDEDLSEFGVMTASFFRHGEWEPVVTDTRLPFGPEPPRGRGALIRPPLPVVSRARDADECWVQLLEKAYAAFWSRSIPFPVNLSPPGSRGGGRGGSRGSVGGGSSSRPNSRPVSRSDSRPSSRMGVASAASVPEQTRGYRSVVGRTGVEEALVDLTGGVSHTFVLRSSRVAPLLDESLAQSPCPVAAAVGAGPADGPFLVPKEGAVPESPLGVRAVRPTTTLWSVLVDATARQWPVLAVKWRKDVRAEEDEEEDEDGESKAEAMAPTTRAAGNVKAAFPEEDDVAVDPESGLLTGVAYCIVYAKEVRRGIRLVKIRNVWGEPSAALGSHWLGNWSEDSPLWGQHPEVEVALGEDPAANFMRGQRGSIWMSWDDVLRHFSALTLSRVPFTDLSTSTAPSSSPAKSTSAPTPSSPALLPFPSNPPETSAWAALQPPVGPPLQSLEAPNTEFTATDHRADGNGGKWPTHLFGRHPVPKRRMHADPEAFFGDLPQFLVRWPTPPVAVDNTDTGAGSHSKPVVAVSLVASQEDARVRRARECLAGGGLETEEDGDSGGYVPLRMALFHRKGGASKGSRVLVPSESEVVATDLDAVGKAEDEEDMAEKSGRDTCIASVGIEEGTSCTLVVFPERPLSRPVPFLMRCIASAPGVILEPLPPLHTTEITGTWSSEDGSAAGSPRLPDGSANPEWTNGPQYLVRVVSGTSESLTRSGNAHVLLRVHLVRTDRGATREETMLQRVRDGSLPPAVAGAGGSTGGVVGSATSATTMATGGGDSSADGKVDVEGGVTPASIMPPVSSGTPAPTTRLAATTTTAATTTSAASGNPSGMFGDDVNPIGILLSRAVPIPTDPRAARRAARIAARREQKQREGGEAERDAAEVSAQLDALFAEQDDENAQQGASSSSSSSSSSSLPPRRSKLDSPEWSRASGFGHAVHATSVLRVPLAWLDRSAGIILHPMMRLPRREGAFRIQVSCSGPHLEAVPLPHRARQFHTSEWTSHSSQGSHLHTDWLKNPAFELRPSPTAATATFTVALTRPPAPWRKAVAADGVGTMIGLYAVTADLHAEPRAADGKAGILAQTSFVPLNQVKLTLQLDCAALRDDDKKVLFFPATFEPNHPGPFQIELLSTDDPGATFSFA